MRKTMKQLNALHKNLALPRGKYTKELDKLEILDKERQTVECWSRAMGYHRPVSNYNIGKKQEFADRKYFKEPKEL